MAAVRAAPPRRRPSSLQARQSQRDRFKDVGVVDEVVEADRTWRLRKFECDALNQLQRACAKGIGALMKARTPGSGEEVPAGTAEAMLEQALAKQTAAFTATIGSMSVAQLKALVVAFKAMQAQKTAERGELAERRDALRRRVGNILHPSVPVAKDEDEVALVKTVGPVGDAFRRPRSHYDLIVMIDGVDYERGQSTAGKRGYYLKGPGVALEQALIQLALEQLTAHGYTPLSPPLFVKGEVMQEVAQLSQFAEELFRVVGKASEVATDTAVDEKFLIATAEQPIAAFHRHERIEEKQLPIRYVGVSECFRQEVGSHGRDTRGIFRVKQFKKVEQFALCHPAESWALFEQMMARAEDFCQAIGLSYRVVNLPSGDLNLAAAKKHDLEAWFPGQGTYRELVSCSNCTDYQSRRLEVRLGGGVQGQNEYVHMLNSTLCATTRYVCCILESFQTEGGVVVPESLRRFMPERYREFLPFVREPPEVVP